MLDDTPQTGCDFRPGWHLLRAKCEGQKQKKGLNIGRFQKKSYLVVSLYNKAYNGLASSSENLHPFSLIQLAS